MNCGTILHDREFQFSDGTTGNKLIVILSNFGSNHLACKTTSKQHSKNRKAGCQINDKPPNFFIQRDSHWFELDTWVELDEVFELDSNILTQKIKDKTALNRGSLPNSLMRDLLNCALQSEDVDLIYLDVLGLAVKKI